MGVNLVCSAQVVVNEYLCSNINGIVSLEGETSDWIELYNAGASAVDLNGYGLSDRPSEPFAWTFPHAIVEAGEYLLVFASGRDLRLGPDQWETVVDWGDAWRFRVNDTAPPASWQAPEFDDSSWEVGSSGIGYGDGDDATLVPVSCSVSCRISFEIDDPDQVVLAMLHVDYDDGFAAWINGIEVARANLVSSPAWDQLTGTDHEAHMYGGGLPEIFALDASQLVLYAGQNVLAIEVHNVSLESSDMTLIPFLTVGMQEPRQDSRGVSQHLAGQLSLLHTSFKLAAGGETLCLSSPDGVLVDTVTTGEMLPDISRGRFPDGATSWRYYDQPTPGSPNGLEGWVGVAGAPLVSPAGGLYSQAQVVTVTGKAQLDSVFITTDGSVPTQASTPASASLLVNETTVLRARAFRPDCLPSPTVSSTYVIDDPSTLLVTALTTDPVNLYDPETGIAHPDNLWQSWERPIHVEVWEPDGTLGFAQDAGVKLYGGWTRNLPQKSLRLIARAGYGDAEFDYRVFPAGDADTFRQLVLRNSGNDWCASMLRDPLMHRLARHTTIDVLAYRPSRVYLNGSYRGIYNIREHIDEDYLAAHHDVDPEQIDLIKNFTDVVEGDASHYEEMMSFVEANALASEENYAVVTTMMDVEQYLDYVIFQIYYANTDWPGNNIAWWRSRDADGRWRWILYDTDFGLGLMESYLHNTLSFALEPNGPDWPNPPYATLLLRRLMENHEFKQRFINRFADHLNTSLLPSRALAVTDQLAAAIQPEIERHMLRWNTSVEVWEDNMATIRQFLELRPEWMRWYLTSYFGLGDEYLLTLDVSPAHAGAIELDAAQVDSRWSGSYFQGNPVRLEALPGPRHRFVGWSDSSVPQEAVIEIDPDQDYELTAIFEQLEALPARAVINEINYHSADDFDPADWVELHNPGDQPVDLSGWSLVDDDGSQGFRFADGTTLPAGGYLVLCEDMDAFTTLFPSVSGVLGDSGFGFDGDGESLRLLDAQGAVQDAVTYRDEEPWPAEPDGHGPTLELVSAWLDNTLAAHWVASRDHGSPGGKNLGPVSDRRHPGSHRE